MNCLIQNFAFGSSADAVKVNALVLNVLPFAEYNQNSSDTSTYFLPYDILDEAFSFLFTSNSPAEDAVIKHFSRPYDNIYGGNKDPLARASPPLPPGGGCSSLLYSYPEQPLSTCGSAVCGKGPLLFVCTYEGEVANESKTVCAYRSAPVAARTLFSGIFSLVEDTTAFIVDEEGKIFRVAEGWSRQAVQDGVSEGGYWTPSWGALRIDSDNFLQRAYDPRYPGFQVTPCHSVVRRKNRFSRFELWHLDVPFTVQCTQARLSKREIAERIRENNGSGVPTQISKSDERNQVPPSPHCAVS
eukprot:PhM_4_TR16452/c1_g2_i1/m.96011